MGISRVKTDKGNVNEHQYLRKSREEETKKMASMQKTLRRLRHQCQ
jgi:hypothetical protein